MLWVGSLPGKKYNPQGKFRPEYVNQKILSSQKVLAICAPGAGWEGINPREPNQPTPPLDRLPHSR
jgi:hypothetical protein